MLTIKKWVIDKGLNVYLKLS